MKALRFETAPDARPIERLTAVERDALAQRLLPAWSGWCERWGLAQPRIAAEPLVQGAVRLACASPWTRVERPGAGALCQSGLPELVRAAMGLAPETTWPQGGLADSLALAVHTSLTTWLESWFAAAGDLPARRRTDSPLADLGDVVLSFSCRSATGTQTLQLRVGADVVRPLLPERSTAGTSASAPVAALTAAIAHLPVRVQIHLDPAGLALGQLMELHPGDVVPLPHPLGRPASMRLAAAPQISLAAAARLGRQDGHWAVRLDAQVRKQPA